MDLPIFLWVTDPFKMQVRNGAHINFQICQKNCIILTLCLLNFTPQFVVGLKVKSALLDHKTHLNQYLETFLFIHLL